MKCKVIVREWMDDVEFYFYKEINHEIYIAEPIANLTFKKHEEYRAIDPKRATFTLKYSEAINFVESILSESRHAYLGSSQRMRSDDVLEGGELKATKYHLEDMRLMVEKLMVSFVQPPAPLIQPRRVIEAARSCGTAAQVLQKIFPEYFPPGWENR